MTKNLTKIKSNKTGANFGGAPVINIMANMKKTLKCLGMWEQDQPYSLYHPSTLLFIISVLFSGNLSLAEFVYIFKCKTVFEVAEGSGAFIGTMGVGIKMCDLFVHREQFFKLVKNLEDAFDEGLSIGKHTDMLLNYHRQATRNFNLYLGLWLFILISFAMLPIIIYALKLASGFDNQAILQLPYKAEIFYTSGIANRLMIDYIVLAICFLVVVLWLAPLDCYLGCACLYIIPLIKILKEDLENISYVANTGRESDVRRQNMHFRSEVHVEARLLQFMKDHQRVISFVDQLEEVCNRQMLVHFIYTTMQLCLMFFQATHDIHNAEKTFSYAFISIGTFSQLLFCTYYGQALRNEASQLEFAVYNISWFDKSVKFRRLIPLILMRVQKPLGVTAFKYCPVSMAAFASVLKTVMSYFTLLQQVTENGEKN